MGWRDAGFAHGTGLRSLQRLRSLRSCFKLQKELSRPQHSLIAPRVQHQQILITGHDDLGTSGQGQFQVAVVLGVPAVPDLLARLDPECRSREQFEDFAASVVRQNPRELWPCQNLGNLSEYRFRQSDDASCSRGGQSAAGYSTWV